MVTTENIEHTVTEGHAELVLNGSSVYAFTPEMLLALGECLFEAMNDDDVYVVILIGQGGTGSAAEPTSPAWRDARTGKRRSATAHTSGRCST